MIGREAQLARLVELMDGVVRSGRPGVAFVTGEAGVGKTRLLREFIGSLTQDAQVVAGQAREGDVQRPFALVRDAVEEHVPRTGELPAELERWRHPMGHLLHPLVPEHDHVDDGHEHSQEELVRTGVLLVRHLVRDSSGVVLLEDLQWADAESLQLTERLVRSDAALLVVATFRPEEFDRRHALAEFLADVERHHPATHLPVERLSRTELAQFLEAAGGQPVTTSVVRRLHERTRGNPFFVEELLASIGPADTLEGGASVVDSAALVGAELPWNTAEAVLRRLERFDSRTRDVLHTAAVLGDRFELDVLAHVVGMAEDELLEVVRRLVQFGILMERSPDVFIFRHAMTWEAIREELLEREKRAIHERALAALEATRSTRPEAMAHHAAAAGRDDEAIHHAKIAAHQAFHAGGLRSVLHLARLVLDRRPEEVDIHALAARAAAQLGDFEEAGVHAEAWMDLAAAMGDLPGQARAACHLTWVLWWAGEPERSQAVLQEAMRLSERLNTSPIQAEVAATQARFLLTSRRPAEAVARADEAILLADKFGDDRTRVRAWVAKATGIIDSLDHQQDEQLREGAALLDRARDEASRIGDIETLAAALHNRLVPDQPDDLSPERSLELVAEANALAEQHGLERLADKLSVLEVHHAIAVGDRRRADLAIAGARRARLAPAELNWRARLEAHLALERGDIDQALTVHETQYELLWEPYEAEAQMDTAFVEAAIAAHRADPDGGLAGLQRASSCMAEVCPCVAANWWDIAMAALDAGVETRHVETLLQHESPLPLDRHAGIVAHFHGVRLAHQGRTQEALDSLQQSVRAPRRGRRATLLADAHMRLAELLARLGDKNLARTHIDAARQFLARWPGPRRERLSALERRMGGQTESPHDLFTPRELEVVRLMARGYTNLQIAEQLFVSRKTASTHVSNILTKTGFDSRTQVAAWAIGEGIASPPA